uniref:Uncharacterized protein n=1 Tax=Ditylenchus dipsaci TaxID=166011 RepID=A0A915CTS7_9BILA
MDIEQELAPIVTAREITAGFNVFQSHVEQNFKDPGVLQMCYKFGDLLADERLKKLKQKKLSYYFASTS